MPTVVTNVFPLDRNLHRRVAAFQALAEATRAYGQDVFVSAPQKLHKGGPVRGWEFVGPDSGEGSEEGIQWRQSVRPLQDHTVFFDSTYLGAPRLERQLLQDMRTFANKSKLPWFNPLLPGKHRLFQWLARQPLELGSVPITYSRLTLKRLRTGLTDGKMLWLKPAFGSGGMNMVRIQHVSSNQYRVVGERMREGPIDEILSHRELEKMLRVLFTRQPYFLQENVPLLADSNGSKMDFRVTLVRNRSGIWQTIAVTLRKSAPESYLTNYHAGGSIFSLDLQQGHLSQNHLPSSSEVVSLERIQRFAQSIAAVLQAAYPALGTLGIDVAQANDGRLYVYDCNTRPGRDILTETELVQFMRNVAGFAVYLQEQHLLEQR